MERAPQERLSALLAPFHRAAQAAGLYSDSKTLVDMPLAAAPEEVAAAFAALTLPAAEDTRRAALQQFCERWLLPAGSDLAPAAVPGLDAGPPAGWLPLVAEPAAREWAESLFRTWGLLCREAVPAVAAHPERHSLLMPPSPRPFVVPGARFREQYYWDTLWALRGMLACGLAELAQGVVCNMLGMVERHGFVPNGCRDYYLNRSQPPLLSQMVAHLHAAAPDADLLRRALHALVREHAYWEAGRKLVVLRAADGTLLRLSRYWADWEQPRPESYREDVATAAGLAPAAAAALWRQLATAAESGWDFSSRWLADGAALRSCRTTRVVPADLNAWLYQSERNIASFADELGEAELAGRFRARAAARLDAIQRLLWDGAGGQWRDLVLTEPDAAAAAAAAAEAERRQAGHAGAAGEPGPAAAPQPDQAAELYCQAAGGFQRSFVVAASNWVPLYCGCAAAGSPQAAAAVASLRASGLVQAAGVAVTLQETGQQWDAPNAWPPLTCMLLEGCRDYGGQEGAQLAAALAQQFLDTALAAWRDSGRNWEKFDARRRGAPGGGGEYEVVHGFGWTNGVALLLMEAYGWRPEALTSLPAASMAPEA